MALSKPPRETSSFGLGAWLIKLWAFINVIFNGAEAWKAKAVDSAADALMAETVIPRTMIAGTITKIEFLPESGGLTASDTLYATIVFRKRTALGVATTLATKLTNVAGGNWTQWVRKNLGALTVASLTATDVVTVEITAKASTGTVVPAGHWIVTVAGT